MENSEFLRVRKKLKKTQKEMAQLLGISVKTVYSYEQGWRTVPSHVERQMFFLLSKRRGAEKPRPCWVVKKCPTSRKKQCPAWEFRAGRFCWLINGTICECRAQKNWQVKMQICRQCEVLKSILDNIDNPLTAAGSGGREEDEDAGRQGAAQKTKTGS